MGLRRAGRHAKGLQYVRVLAQKRGLDVRQIAGAMEGYFNVFGDFDTCFTERDGREFHEPVVVHVDGLRDVRLPHMWFIKINRHVCSRDRGSTSQPVGCSVEADDGPPRS